MPEPVGAPETYRDEDGLVWVYEPHWPGNVLDCEWDEISGHDESCNEPSTWTQHEEGPDTLVLELCDAHKRQWVADHERL